MLYNSTEWPPAINLFLRRATLFFAMMASGGNNIVLREIWIVLTIIFSLVLFRGKFHFSETRTPMFAWVLITMFSLTFVQQPEAIVSIISRGATFISSILLIQMYSDNNRNIILDDLSFIFKIFCIQAILTYLLGTYWLDAFSVVHISTPLDPLGADYYTIGYIFNFHYVNELFRDYVRPDGFFYESGVFQIYISIFLYICLFERFDLRWALAALAATFVIWSSVGIAVAILLMILAAPKIFQQLRGVWAALALTGAVLVFSVLVVFGIQNYEEKTTGALAGSSMARNYDFYTGLNIVMDNPVFGIGFSVQRYIEYNRTHPYMGTDLDQSQTIDRANSNGLIQIFYALGIPIGFPLMVCFFTQRLFRRRFIMAGVLLASFASQSLVFTPFFLSILLTGMILKVPMAAPRLRQLVQ